MSVIRSSNETAGGRARIGNPRSVGDLEHSGLDLGQVGAELHPEPGQSEVVEALDEAGHVCAAALERVADRQQQFSLFDPRGDVRVLHDVDGGDHPIQPLGAGQHLGPLEAGGLQDVPQPEDRAIV